MSDAIVADLMRDLATGQKEFDPNALLPGGKSKKEKQDNDEKSKKNKSSSGSKKRKRSRSRSPSKKKKKRKDKKEKKERKEDSLKSSGDKNSLVKSSTKVLAVNGNEVHTLSSVSAVGTESTSLSNHLRERGHGEKEKSKTPEKIQAFPLSKNQTAKTGPVSFVPRNIKLKTVKENTKKDELQKISDDEEEVPLIIKPATKKPILFGELKSVSKLKEEGKKRTHVPGEDGEIPSSDAGESSGAEMDLSNESDGELSEWSEKEVSPRKKERSPKERRRPSSEKRSSSRRKERYDSRKLRRRSPDYRRSRRDRDSRHEDRYHRRRRERSRSGERSIDKKKLLAIAKRNASAMLQSGTLQEMRKMSADEIAKLRAGGKSVDELVDYCKMLSKKSGEAVSSSEEETRNSEDEKDFLNHPFALDPNRKNIVMNIPNSVPLPILTPSQRTQHELILRHSFPVSSGQQHRRKEDEWEPVTPYIPLPSSGKPKAITAAGEPQPPPDILNMPLPPPPPAPAMFALTAPPVFQEPPPPPSEGIGSIVGQRLEAIKKLQSNPNDMEALKMMQNAEQQMKQWAESKNMPGAFTGTTDIQILTPEQLAPPDKRSQAWARKDQLRTAKAVKSDVGMSLLKKMGWNPGDRLGKHQTGALEPLSLDIKADRKGLVALEEMPASKSKPHIPFTKDLQGKHPVSALMEVCSKRRWPPPSFDCIESGSSHNRRFLWKAIVNGVEYQPATPAANKKNGKLAVCQVVLQSLGLVPREPNLPIIIG